ncbi:helix-turn-helix domain-containing protein [Parasediminibacterium paludis]|uniref:Helix-turn-helix domain-containing protein n=1 Tax=Parasediminibacterium paludis TaxID=908966 RepID=A0ABV8PZG0_9BACT
MNLPLKLSLFREYRIWTPEDVANELLMPIDDYNKLEKGKTKLNGIVAQQLSDLYRVPIEFFMIDDTPNYYQADVMYTNCSFSGGGSNGYINHQYNDRGIDEIIASKNSEIKTLKQQLETVQQQNNKFIELLGKNV